MLYYLSIISIFKNEGHCINEWIEHHLLEGVDHFYLLDNGSNDNYQIDPKFLNKINLYHDSTPFAQNKLLNKYFLNKVKKETEWVLYIDLDEFMYSRLGYNTISEYLKSIQSNVMQIGVPWKMFGSSGFIYQPKNIINYFMYREFGPKQVAIKSFIKTNDLIKLGVHVHSNKYNSILLLDKIIYNSIGIIYVDEDFLNKSPLHLNHYPIQSFEFFRKIKMTRGDIQNSTFLKIRNNIKYFNEYDKNSNYKDNELAIKRYIFNVNDNNLKDINVYGCGIYLDVSNINVDWNKRFNDIFGDPVPNKRKFYIVRKNNSLKIYEEQ